MIVTNFIARWIVKIAAKMTPGTQGVTIWPFIFIWPPEYKAYQSLIRHESVHLKQWLRYWWIGFPFVYLFQYFVCGYESMALEVEARIAEKMYTE